MTDAQIALDAQIEVVRAHVGAALDALDALNAIAAPAYVGDDDRGAFAHAVGALCDVGECWLDVRECDDFDYDALA